MAGSNLAKASHFILAASPIMNNKILADPEAYNKREFRSMFGTTPQVCATLWNLVDPTGPDSPLSMGRPKYEHLLCCCSEVASSYSSVAECDLQTRKKQFGRATLRRRCFSDYSHCTLRLLAEESSSAMILHELHIVGIGVGIFFVVRTIVCIIIRTFCIGKSQSECY